MGQFNIYATWCIQYVRMSARTLAKGGRTGGAGDEVGSGGARERKMVRLRLSERCRNTSSPSERTIATRVPPTIHDANVNVNVNVSAMACTLPRFRGYSTQSSIIPSTLNTAQYPSPRAARCSIYLHLQRYTNGHMLRVLYILYIHTIARCLLFSKATPSHTHTDRQTHPARVCRVSLLPSLPSTASMHAPALLTSFFFLTRPPSTVHPPLLPLGPSGPRANATQRTCVPLAIPM